MDAINHISYAATWLALAGMGALLAIVAACRAIARASRTVDRLLDDINQPRKEEL